METLIVRTLIQEFCTRAFEFYMLTSDKTTNFGTGALYVLVGPMLHEAAITQLRIMIVTALNKTNRTFHNSLQLRLYLCQIQ